MGGDGGIAGGRPGLWGEIDLDTYGDYLDMAGEGLAAEKGVVTDRFIPARKHLRL
jgi:hypothetical protein